jgi:hypothetical protein
MGAAKGKQMIAYESPEAEARAKKALDDALKSHLAEKKKAAGPKPLSQKTFSSPKSAAAFNQYVKEFISREARAAVARKEFPANMASLQGKIKGMQFFSKLISRIRTSAQNSNGIQITKGFSVTPERLSQGVAEVALDFLNEDPDYKNALVSENKRWQDLSNEFRSKNGPKWLRIKGLGAEASKMYFDGADPKIQKMQPLFYEAARLKAVLGDKELHPMESYAMHKAQGRAATTPDAVVYKVQKKKPAIKLVNEEVRFSEIIDNPTGENPEVLERGDTSRNQYRLLKSKKGKSGKFVDSIKAIKKGALLEDTYNVTDEATGEIRTISKSRGGNREIKYATSKEPETVSLYRNQVEVLGTPGRQTDLSLPPMLDTENPEIQAQYQNQLASSLKKPLQDASSFFEDPEINEIVSDEQASQGRKLLDRTLNKYLGKISKIPESSVIRSDAEGIMLEMLQQGRASPNMAIDREALSAAVTRLGALLKTGGFRALPYIGILSDILQAYQISEEHKERQAKFNKTYYQ